ncbi:hypothetical protein HN51_054773, partial [Arachis hypogaea]
RTLRARAGCASQFKTFAPCPVFLSFNPFSSLVSFSSQSITSLLFSFFHNPPPLSPATHR